MENSVHGTDMRQKVVPQSFALVCSTDQSSDIVNFKESWHLGKRHSRIHQRPAVRPRLNTLQVMPQNAHKENPVQTLKEQMKVQLMAMKGLTSLLGLNSWHSQSNLSSGMFTRASFGSIVQKGKFSAGMDNLVKVLNKVDFPTFGSPTCTFHTPVRTLRLWSGFPRKFADNNTEWATVIL